MKIYYITWKSRNVVVVVDAGAAIRVPVVASWN